MLMFWVLQVLLNKLGKMPKYVLNFKLVAITPSELLFWSIYSLNFTHPIHYICQFVVKILTEYAPEMQMMLKYQNQKSKPQWKKRETRFECQREIKQEPTHHPSLVLEIFFLPSVVLPCLSTTYMGCCVIATMTLIFAFQRFPKMPQCWNSIFYNVLDLQGWNVEVH